MGNNMAQILWGKPLSQELENKIKEEVLKLKKINIFPTLLILKIGENDEAENYARNIEKVFSKLDIKVERKNYKEETSFEELISIFNEINNDNSIHGILLLRPLPTHLEKLKVYSYLPYEKDVEGLSYINLGRLFAGDKAFIPCTSLAVIELLDYYNIPLEGKNVVIIGRSISVGKPLALLFLQRNSTVTICHSKTLDLSYHTKRAEILVSAVGRAGIIDEDMVGEESVVIDVGTNIIEGRVVGDVNFERVEKKVKAITPVPGGVGIVTTRILAKNLLEAVKRNEIRI
jgi:methylenetetrahydrofolate dehydrogenase (NADP+)/methenyltetrahydrofolate cyclohydrolase